MIFIPADTSIIKDALEELFNTNLKETKKYPQKDIFSHEFDQTQYRIFNSGQIREELTVSIKIPHTESVAMDFGLPDYLRHVFGDFITEPEEDMTATLFINLSTISAEDKKMLLAEVPKIKVHCFCPCFFTIFDKYLKKQKFDGIAIPYRTDETVYIMRNEKVFSVIFSVRFNDDDDIVLGKNFLQELKDSKRVDRSLINSPAVTYTFGAKPSIMRQLKNVRERGKTPDYSFVVFSLFERHMNEKHRFETVSKLLVFRNFLHYHLKCSKANMHIRMRQRVAKLLQALESSKDMSGIDRQKRDRKGRYLDTSKRKYGQKK